MPGASNCKKPVILLNDVDVSLPRPSTPTFDSDPLKCETFANNFQVHVTPKVRTQRYMVFLSVAKIARQR